MLSFRLSRSTPPMPRILFALIAMTGSWPAFGEPPRSEDAFVSQVRDAVASGDPARLDALTYRDGMSEQDRAMSARVNQRLVESAAKIDEVALRALPKDLITVAIQHGRKVEMTAPPVGMIEIKSSGGPLGPSGSSSPYAVVDGVFFLVGPKSSDLGWNGPPDKNLGFMVTGQGVDQARIVVAWNASGVDQTREFAELGSTFWGQHIQAVTVTTDAADAVLQLTVLEDGITIHTSETLRGKGTLAYRRHS